MKSWTKIQRAAVILAIAFSLMTAPFVGLSEAFNAAAASRDPVRARHGIVASTSQIASQVGVDVM
ncbi:MAG: gamma-glutamyltransferase, partial [Pyrinomonadaceae bacterium]